MQANVNCNGKGCHPWPVRVMKCREGRNHHFYVYELPPVPSCPMAYCAGNSTFQRELSIFGQTFILRKRVVPLSLETCQETIIKGLISFFPSNSCSIQSKRNVSVRDENYPRQIILPIRFTCK